MWILGTRRTTSSRSSRSKYEMSPKFLLFVARVVLVFALVRGYRVK